MFQDAVECRLSDLAHQALVVALGEQARQPPIRVHERDQDRTAERGGQHVGERERVGGAL